MAFIKKFIQARRAAARRPGPPDVSRHRSPPSTRGPSPAPSTRSHSPSFSDSPFDFHTPDEVRPESYYSTTCGPSLAPSTRSHSPSDLLFDTLDGTQPLSYSEVRALPIDLIHAHTIYYTKATVSCILVSDENTSSTR